MPQAPPKLKVLRFTKILMIVFSLLGFVTGILYSVGGLISDLLSSGSLNRGTALAFLALIGMPILFALAGLLCGPAGGWMFNRFSGALNKFQLDLNLLED